MDVWDTSSKNPDVCSSKVEVDCDVQKGRVELQVKVPNFNRLRCDFLRDIKSQRWILQTLPSVDVSSTMNSNLFQNDAADLLSTRNFHRPLGAILPRREFTDGTPKDPHTVRSVVSCWTLGRLTAIL